MVTDKSTVQYGSTDALNGWLFETQQQRTCNPQIINHWIDDNDA